LNDFIALTNVSNPTTLLFVEKIMSHSHKINYIFQQILKYETEGVNFMLNPHFL